MKREITGAVVIALVLGASVAQGDRWQVAESIEVAPVWSGHPVGFCLLTHGDHQFVAYYDAERRMTVASRRLGQDSWQRTVLPSQIGWDSHNYITMAVDAAGYVHLAGNMHCDPLVYFRTTRPLDATTFEPIHRMTGREEERCTYPHFLTRNDGRLVFYYRIGSSGNGRRIFNIYDTESGAWQRLLDRPLLDGQGQMNAYPVGPKLGPDGRYHLAWMWRDTPDCRTNHDLSYARSEDLVRWETAAGDPIELPITIQTPGVVVDATPSHGGLFNASFGLGFDGQERPVITYHNYDSEGNSQIFNARFEGDRWHRYQTSDWDVRWEFSGGGSVGTQVRAGAIEVLPDGDLVQAYRHYRYGGGRWRLDPQTFRIKGEAPPQAEMPSAVRRRSSDFPGIQVRTRSDSGSAPRPDRRYLLKWETLGPNRDRPRQGEIPPPSMLRLFGLERVADESSQP